MNPSHLTLLNQARQNAQQGSPEKALALFKQLLEVSRNDAEVQASAYFEIGKLYTNIHKDELALKFFKKAISMNPEVLIQEFDWLQDLKRRNKKHIYEELEKTQSQFKDYLIDQTKEAAEQRSAYNTEPVQSASFGGSASAEPAPANWHAESGSFKLAGFWKRVVATIVDYLIILFVNLILLLILVYGFGLTMAAFVVPVTEEEAFAAGFIGGLMGYMIWYGVSILIWWLYYAIMESSRCQGTLGKMLLGIYIADEDGRRIDIGKASGRYFLKALLYAVPFINVIDCLMVAVTKRKQAWHDMPVGCLVLSKR